MDFHKIFFYFWLRRFQVIKIGNFSFFVFSWRLASNISSYLVNITIPKSLKLSWSSTTAVPLYLLFPLSSFNYPGSTAVGKAEDPPSDPTSEGGSSRTVVRKAGVIHLTSLPHFGGISSFHVVRRRVSTVQYGAIFWERERLYAHKLYYNILL